MEGHIPPAVQSLHLVAHVFEQQLVLVQVHLQPAPEQAQQELHPGRRDHTLEERRRVRRDTMFDTFNMNLSHEIRRYYIISFIFLQ